MPRIQPNCLDYLPKFDKVKSITILEPIGPEYSVADVPNGQVQNTIDSNNHITGKMQTTPFADPQSQTVLSGLNLVTQQADGQYHVGNAEDGNLQLYRIYSGQVILCTPDRAIAYEHRTREKIEYSLNYNSPPPNFLLEEGRNPGRRRPIRLKVVQSRLVRLVRAEGEELRQMLTQSSKQIE